MWKIMYHPEAEQELKKIRWIATKNSIKSNNQGFTKSRV